jgi:hypothetical protein
MGLALGPRTLVSIDFFLNFHLLINKKFNKKDVSTVIQKLFTTDFYYKFVIQWIFDSTVPQNQNFKTSYLRQLCVKGGGGKIAVR